MGMYHHHHHFACILLITFSLYVCPGYSDYPGLRRPPNWAQSSQTAAEEADLLAQIIEEQARRRFHQQLAQQHYYQSHHQQRGPNAQAHHHQHYHHHHQQQQQQPQQNQILQEQDPLSYSSSSNSPSFSYSFPEKLVNNDNNKNHYNNDGQSSSILNDDIPFAVDPSDPRYYEKSPSSYLNNKNKLNNDENDSQYHQQYEQFNTNIVPYSRLKPPMEVNPKMPSILNNFGKTNKINDLVDKLERENQYKTTINNSGSNILDNQHEQRSDVTKKHMGIDNEMGMYIVALIAGLSAAVTVGLIALGIGWYTLQKRTKAAADVDYPAYGVTGPNKDISPSGDRRLAQSAQMYHYQHQKQQIIAMENRATGENVAGMSDVDSDDDNDEGDYTVYECPGLAPTGEMEVKNPLFVDDTPVTPSTSTADGPPQLEQQQPQQQQQIQKPQQQNIQNSANQSKSTSKPSSRKSSKSSQSGSTVASGQQQNKPHKQSTDDGTKKASGK